MAKVCFCGCGREIPFGRRHAGSVLAGRMRRDVARELEDV